MKKTFILHVILLIFIIATPFSQVLTAQNTTIQIGDGTSGGGAPLYGPVYRFSTTSATTHARCNLLFSPQELQAAGITPGSSISALGFEKILDPYFITPATFKIYMANSSNTILQTTTTWASILATHTLVYTNNSFNVPPVAGWVSWAVTPFIYTGGSLEVATDLVMAGGTGSTTGFWRWSYTDSTSPDMVIGATGTGTAPEVLNGTNATYKHRANMSITFKPEIPTPITLLAFTAIKKGQTAQLGWIIADAKDFSHFELEKSDDGAGKFNLAGIIRPNIDGSEKYTYSDRMISKFVYYRLKMVDKDGSFKYSNTIRLVNNSEIKAIKMLPNPVTDRASIQFSMTGSKEAEIQVMDMMGRVLQTYHHRNLREGTNVIQLNTGPLLKGSYYLKIITAGCLYTQGFLKQ